MARLVQQAQHPILIHSEGRIVAANDAAASLFGAESAAALVGMSGAAILDPEEREYMLERARTIARTGEPSRRSIQKMRRLDGSGPLFIELSGYPIASEGKTFVLTLADDVSARVALEQGAARRERELDEAQRLGRLGSFTWDLATGEVRGSKGLQAMFGLPEVLPVTTMHQRFLHLVHPDDRLLVRAGISALPESREAIDHEYRLVLDDEVRWFRTRAERQVDEQGRVVAVAGVTQDITTLRRAVDAEQSFMTLFEGVPDAMLVVASGGHIALANPAATTMLGYSPEELASKTVEDLVVEPERRHHAELRSSYEGSRASRPMAGARRVLALTGDGRELPVEIGLGPATFQGLPVIIATMRDVSARVEAERVLRESEARFRAFFDLAPDGIFTCDAGGRYVSVNEAGCRMLGYSRDELLARSLTDIIVPDGSPPRLDELAVGQSTFAARTLLRADGTTIPVEISACRLPSGKMQGIVRDVSERRRSEEALREAQKLDAVGRLAGGVAHDFNNLLTVILSLTEELLESLDGQDQITELLRDVRDAGQRGAELTRQLLTFARRQRSAPRPIDLSEHIRGFARLLARVIGEDVRMTLDLAPSLWPILLDPQHAEQVLMNLAINARDAMPQGGELSLHTRNVPGAMATVELEVRDTGDGIDATSLQHLFEPFFTTKSVGKGTGLGLATVYGIVKQASGDIDVASSPQQGTTFRLRFPTCAAEVPAAPSPARSTRAGNARVLVVEDEHAVRAIVARTLTQAGYTVLQAASVAEARSLLLTAGPLDLLVSDVVMPGEDGTQLAQELTRATPGLPVLFVSGYARGIRGVESLGHFLQKPFTPETLLLAVQRALGDGEARSTPR